MVKVMNLFIVRHGQTDSNKKHKLSSNTDEDLNETGYKQAKEVAYQLKDIKFDVCFCSPYKRTINTAQCTCDKVICDDRLKERDFGSLEGKHYNPNIYWNYSANSSHMGVESIQALLARTKSFLDMLKSTYPSDANILIVSHAATIRAIHFNIIGYTDNTDFMTFKVPNCSIHKYTI